MKYLLIICSVAFLSISCSREADKKTIQLYAHASEVYAKGMFAETAELLYKTGKFPPAIMLRAKAEYFNNEHEKAEKSCRRVLKLQPSSYEARLYLIRIYREKNDLYNAIKLTESLLADNPFDIRILRLAAEFAVENGKYDEAAGLLDRAAELSAESALVLLDRARLHWTAGKGMKALEDLSRAKAMLPWDTPLLRSIMNLEKTILEVL